MADETVMRKFLIEIGYKLDTASQNAATNAVNNITDALKRLAAAAAAAYGVKAILDFNRNLNDAAIAARRLGTEARSLDAFAKSGETAGASIGEMLASVKTLNDFVKSHTPEVVKNYFERWAKGSGITKNAVTGDLQDIQGHAIKTEEAITTLFEGLRKKAEEEWPLEQRIPKIKAWLELHGYTWNQYLTIIDRGRQQLEHELNQIDALYGRNYVSAIKHARIFEEEYTKTLRHLTDIYQQTLAEINLSGYLEQLNTYLIQHSDEVNKNIEWFANKVREKFPEVKNTVAGIATAANDVSQAIGGWGNAITIAMGIMYPKLTALYLMLRLISEYGKGFDQIKKGFEEQRDITKHEWSEIPHEAAPGTSFEEVFGKYRGRKRTTGEPEGPPVPNDTKTATNENTKATDRNTNALDRFVDWLRWRFDPARDQNMINEQRAKLGIGGSGAGGGATPGGPGGGSSGRGEMAIGGAGTESEKAFAKSIYDKAKAMGIPDTQAQLAALQAAHESAYGTSDLAKRANNLFGIKGEGDQGKSGEYAAFSSTDASLRRWWEILQKNWPGAATAKDVRSAVMGLRFGQQGGYAEDPRYMQGIETAMGRVGSVIGEFGGKATGSASVAGNVNLQGVRSSLLGDVNAAIDEYFKMTGKHAQITSGYRTFEQQSEIYQRSGGGTKFAAARPGTSHHETGSAIDIDPASADAMERLGILGRHGLHRPYAPRDRPHIEQIAAMINLENRRNQKYVTPPLGHNWTTINNATKQNTTNIDVGGLQTHVHLGEAQSHSIGLLNDVVQRSHAKFATKIRQMGTVIGT